MRTFIDYGSVFELSIDKMSQAELLEQWQYPKLPQTLFDDIAQRVFKKLERQYQNEFKTSDSFSRMCISIQNPASTSSHFPGLLGRFYSSEPEIAPLNISHRSEIPSTDPVSKSS